MGTRDRGRRRAIITRLLRPASLSFLLLVATDLALRASGLFSAEGLKGGRGRINGPARTRMSEENKKGTGCSFGW